MAKGRASKGHILLPAVAPNISAERREKWLNDAETGFVSPSAANKLYYKVILEALWPIGHGIPGPVLTQQDIRNAVDAYRAKKGENPYKDVFRRVRELQGEEGFTSIVKEGVKYQLHSLQLGSKREPRARPQSDVWQRVVEKFGHRCANCGAMEPEVQLSPDHRVPRSRGGGNEEENWQPLCEQCNNIKSNACQGCTQNCYTCPWAFPETNRPIIVADKNKEEIRRLAEKKGVHQSDLVNEILTDYFNKSR